MQHWTDTMLMFWNKKSSNIAKTRYYYANNSRFEQSFDVYQNTTAPNDALVVLLVIGSGWMGHQPWVYGMTSWWNSGGPRNIAHLGYTCVCIRHRGAYFCLPSFWNILTFGIIMLGILSAVIKISTAILITLAMVSLLVFLKKTGQGSAKFEEMLDDVARAVKFIQMNKEAALGIHTVSPHSSAIDLSHYSGPKFCFGGYSSGGHVAATLLQQPHILKANGLTDDPTQLFDGILMISGVLAVEPIEKLKVGLNKPRFLTDFVMTTVWGNNKKRDIPSPINDSRIPKMPHLLIGNRHEVFGLNWLDIFFCSFDFAKNVNAAGIKAVYKEVGSDHWNILASRVLQDVLAEELPKLVGL